MAAIGSYQYHGLAKDTDNQFRHPTGSLRGGFMVALIVGDFVVLLAGVLHAWAG